MGHRDIVKSFWIRSRAYYFESFKDYCTRRGIVLDNSQWDKIPAAWFKK